MNRAADGHGIAGVDFKDELGAGVDFMAGEGDRVRKVGADDPHDFGGWIGGVRACLELEGAAGWGKAEIPGRGASLEGDRAAKAAAKVVLGHGLQGW